MKVNGIFLQKKFGYSGISISSSNLLRHADCQ